MQVSVSGSRSGTAIQKRNHTILAKKLSANLASVFGERAKRVSPPPKLDMEKINEFHSM